MHPLQHALEKQGLTQQGLAEKVTNLRWKRDNGKPLRLKQNSVSQICAFKRRVTPDLARAIAHVLGNITAATLVLAAEAKSRNRNAA